MTNLDSILKYRDITLPTKVCLVKAMVFPVVMHGCERWTIMKAEHWRIDPFELWCWKRLLRVPWNARRSNQSILEEISPEYSLEERKLKLKLQYFGHLMWRTVLLKRPWCWQGLKAGGEGDDRGWDGCMASPTQWTWVWVNSGSWWWTDKPGVVQSMGLQRVGCDQVTELNWLIWYFRNQFMCILRSIPYSSWQLNRNSLYGRAIIFLNFPLLIRLTHYLLLRTILLYKFYMYKVCIYV